jgi:hypothetical protein
LGAPYICSDTLGLLAFAVPARLAQGCLRSLLRFAIRAELSQHPQASDVVSIPIARSIKPVDAVGFAGFYPWEFRSKKLLKAIWIQHAGREGYECILCAMLGAGFGVCSSSRAVAGGRKAGKSGPQPTGLFTNGFANHCARIEARIFDIKHMVFLFTQSCHDRVSET